MNDDIVGWFTTETGQHIPLREGETKKQATERYLNKKMSRVQKNKDKYNKVDEFKKKKTSNNKINDKKNDDDIKGFVKKGNTYLPVREGEDDEIAIRRYENTFRATDSRSRAEQQEWENQRKSKNVERRQTLMKFTQANREQIDKWVREYDDATDKRVAEKVKNNEALSLKEYYGYIARNPKAGDIILSGGKNGEDVVVGKDGKLKAIENYKKRKSTNK